MNQKQTTTAARPLAGNSFVVSVESDGTKNIDWEKVRRRLASLKESASGDGSLTPEQAKKLMDERARTLAQVAEEAPDAREVLRVVTFRLGTERLAIEAHWLQEVNLPGQITPLPGSPDFLEGLTNLRGEVLSVVDLRKFFDISREREEDEDDQSVMLIVGAERVEFGWRVDAVEQVALLRVDKLLDPPGSVSGGCRDLLRGVTGDGMLVINGDALIKDERLFVDQK